MVWCGWVGWLAEEEFGFGFGRFWFGLKINTFNTFGVHPGIFLPSGAYVPWTVAPYLGNLINSAAQINSGQLRLTSKILLVDLNCNAICSWLKCYTDL